MPRRVGVVADSASDLSPATADRAGIDLVPLVVTLGTRSYRDGVDLSPDDFWRRVEAGAVPTTASPSVGELAEAYRRVGDAGASGVVSIHLSSNLSRTVETSRQAALEIDVPVDVVDTRSVSAAQGLVALSAARAAAEGATTGEVSRIARGAAEHLRVAAVMDTPEFLARASGAEPRVGRIGPVIARTSDRAPSASPPSAGPPRRARRLAADGPHGHR